MNTTEKKESPAQQSSKNANKKQRFTRKTWLILAICLFALFGGLYTLYRFNRPLFYAYYSNFKYNDFNSGDKMYAPNWLVDRSSSKDFKSYNIPLYRVVRPLNDDEVDRMEVSLADKISIKKDLSSKKTYMIETEWGISTDSLCKYKNGFIGKYSDSKIANLHFLDQYLPEVFYEIHPIQKALIKNGVYDMPSGYTYDDRFPFYVEAMDVSDKDSNTFRAAK